MTRERAKELLPVIQAFADGKEVQFKSAPRKYSTAKWVTKEDMYFDTVDEFRIKPEPRTFYMREFSDYYEGEFMDYNEDPDCQYIKVIEVLDED